MQFKLGEPYQYDAKKVLHEIKRKENDVCVSVSSDEESEDWIELYIIVLCIRKKKFKTLKFEII